MKSLNLLKFVGALVLCFTLCKCVFLTFGYYMLQSNSQRSNLLNQARLTTLKAQDDHVKVSDISVCMCVCVFVT